MLLNTTSLIMSLVVVIMSVVMLAEVDLVVTVGGGAEGRGGRGQGGCGSGGRAEGGGKDWEWTGEQVK